MAESNKAQKALLTIQTQLKAPKKKTNTFGGYNYRTAEQIYEAVKPMLDITGCYLQIFDTIEQIGDRIYVKATARICDESGSYIEATAYAREPQAKKGMDEAQITGSTSSYARKYALMALFLLDNSDEDIDSDKYREKVEKNTAKEKKEVSPEFNAAYEDFKGICKNAGLSAAAVAREFGINKNTSIDDFQTINEGLKETIASGADLSKWRK